VCKLQRVDGVGEWRVYGGRMGVKRGDGEWVKYGSRRVGVNG
jgi:hypothetical protein